MAGPYSGEFILSNGQRLAMYFAANVAVGIDLPVDISADAASTSQTEFRVASACNIKDFITTETAGTFEIMSDGRPTAVTVSTTATYAATNSGRPKLDHINFRPGVAYRLRMRTAGAA